MSVFLSLCGYVHLSAGVMETRRGHQIPWRWGYRWLWVAHHECRELNTDLLQEKLAFLNVKPYLQPSKDLFYKCIPCVGIRHLCYRCQIYILWESLCVFSHPFHTRLVLSMWSNTLPNKEKQSLQDCSAASNTEPSSRMLIISLFLCLPSSFAFLLCDC